ncbi:MAG TPA: cytochrome c oxidase subunit II [Acidimicrobiales bacterium]|nr:cytochrome c oxidase subunit II [Acidimicrobiales bacterium]
MTAPHPRGGRSRPRWLAVVVAAGGGLLLAGCQLPTFGAYKAVTAQGQDSLKLWQGFFIAGAAVFVVVFALITWAVFRYRRRSDAIPRQTQYHTLLEIFYTTVPVVFVLILFGFTFVTENNVDALPAPSLSVAVTGFQWGWQFQYTTKHVTVIGVELQDPVMVLPQNETVRISLRSHDVIHGFYVPAFDFSRYAQPGITNKFTVDLHTLGTYRGQCTQYCGLFHSLMRFRVEVVTPAQFAAWVSKHKSSGPQTSISTAGKGALSNSTSYTTLTAATGGTGS